VQRLSRISGIIVSATLAACSHGNATSSAATPAATPAAASTAPMAAASSPATAGVKTTPAGGGAHVYQTNCSSCHQLTGQGTSGAFPPLANNPVVTGDPAKLIHIVKYGLTGAVTVGGKTFNGMMPAWGTQLSDADIASALTYVRSAWGNQGSPITAAQVAAVSK
jgi:mono/diheme cytochrome c family protein